MNTPHATTLHYRNIYGTGGEGVVTPSQKKSSGGAGVGEEVEGVYGGVVSGRSAKKIVLKK